MKSIFLLIILILSFFYVKTTMNSGGVDEEVISQFVDYNYNHDNLLLYSSDSHNCDETSGFYEGSRNTILIQKNSK